MITFTINQYGSYLSGRADPNTLITLTHPTTQAVTTITVPSSGNFDMLIWPELRAGESLGVTIQAPNGDITTAQWAPLPPAAPIDVIISTGGDYVTGNTEPNLLVTVRSPDGDIVGTATSDADGNFNVTLGPAQRNAELLQVTASGVGGASVPATVLAPDLTPPDPPTAEVVDWGERVVGQGQPGATIDVKDHTGNHIGSATVRQDGTYEVQLSPPQNYGYEVSVTATDAGGTSNPTTVLSPDTIPPVIHYAEVSPGGDHITGTTEPNVVVEVYDIYGTPLGTATSNVYGEFSITLPSPYTQGEEFKLEAVDQSANRSPSYYVYAPTFPVCFMAGTLIRTNEGDRPVEDLRPGDMIWTKDHGVQPLLWRGERKIEAERQSQNQRLAPVRIAKGALGKGVPMKDLMVSQQHRILIDGAFGHAIFGGEEVLATAKHLVGIEGIDVVSKFDDITYIHLMFKDHEILMSDGALAESFYPGPMALLSLPRASREEVLALRPELKDEDHQPRQARRFATPREVKLLLQSINSARVQTAKLFQEA